MMPRPASILPALCAAVAGLALWQAITMLFAPPAFILPGPAAVLQSAWSNAGLLAFHATVTLAETLLGILCGVSLGIAAALVMAAWQPVQRLLHPLLVFSQIVPVFALAPLLTLWFGYGFGPKVAMAVLIIFFPVTSAFFDGLANTPQDWLDLAASLNATPLRRLLRLRVPAAIPGLVTGLRLALIYAPVGAVIGEWVGASRGLGYLMLFANGRAQADLMFAAVVVLTLLALSLYAIAMAATRLALARYLRR